MTRASATTLRQENSRTRGIQPNDWHGRTAAGRHAGEEPRDEKRAAQPRRLWAVTVAICDAIAEIHLRGRGITCVLAALDAAQSALGDALAQLAG